MTSYDVTDEQLGQLARRQHDLFRRVRPAHLQVSRLNPFLQLPPAWIIPVRGIHFLKTLLSNTTNLWLWQ